MPKTSSQILALIPLKLWSTEVFHKAREHGYHDDRTSAWIRAFSIRNGWKNSQINEVLRYNKALPQRKPPKPLGVICPKCGNTGRLNTFYHRNRAPGRVDYVIVHGPAKGRWGKAGLRKRNRCYISINNSKPPSDAYLDIVYQIQESMNRKTGNLDYKRLYLD